MKKNSEKSISLVIAKRPNLTIGQKKLLNLIVQKIETKDSIRFLEALEIFTQVGCKNIRDGIPHYYDNWDRRDEEGRWWGKYKPMDEYRLRVGALTWLTRNIGSLVLKGYLKVIPPLELE